MNKLVYDGIDTVFQQSLQLGYFGKIIAQAGKTDNYTTAILDEANEVINYPVLDKYGFSLTDDTIIFPTEELEKKYSKNIGLVCANTSGYNYTTLTFTQISSTSGIQQYDILGIHINFHLNAPKKFIITFKDSYGKIIGDTLTIEDNQDTDVYVDYPVENVASFAIAFYADSDELIKISNIYNGGTFEFKNIQNWNIYEEINLTSDDLSINTLECEFFSEYSLQGLSNSRVEFYHEISEIPTLFGVFYLTDLTRTSADTYTLKAQDLIGVADDITYKAPRCLDYDFEKEKRQQEIDWKLNYPTLQDALFSSFWLTNSPIAVGLPIGNVTTSGGSIIPVNDEDKEIMSYIFYDTDLEQNNKVSGYSGTPWLEGGKTWRYSLMQMAFASSCVLDTQRTDKIYFKRLEKDKSNAREISNDSIIGSAVFSKNDVVTKLTITTPSYDIAFSYTSKDSNGNTVAPESTTYGYNGSNSVTLYSGYLPKDTVFSVFSNEAPLNPTGLLQESNSSQWGVQLKNCKLAENPLTQKPIQGELVDGEYYPLQYYEGLLLQSTSSTEKIVVKVGTGKSDTSGLSIYIDNPFVSTQTKENSLIYSDYTLVTGFTNTSNILNNIAPVVFSKGEVTATVVLSPQVKIDSNGFKKLYFYFNDDDAKNDVKTYLLVDLDIDSEHQGEYYVTYYGQKVYAESENSSITLSKDNVSRSYTIFEEYTEDLTDLKVGSLVKINTEYNVEYIGYIRTMSLSGHEDLIADMEITTITPSFLNKDFNPQIDNSATDTTE